MTNDHKQSALKQKKCDLTCLEARIRESGASEGHAHSCLLLQLPAWLAALGAPWSLRLCTAVFLPWVCLSVEETLL